MKITFYGVRGSLPTPLHTDQLQSKISAILATITEKDIATEDAKQRFLSTLPKNLFGTVGGNTACIEIVTGNNDILIFDAGSGIRVCGRKYHNTSTHFNLFFSHFHWDHIQGLPFFEPAYNPKTEIDIYSPFEHSEKYLQDQMRPPYFPVTMDSFTPHINYHIKNELEPFTIGNVEIVCKKMFLPGDSYAYAVTENNKKFIYATDVELKETDFELAEENWNFFNNADVLVLDAQYTLDEAIKKENWGHSAFCYAIDFARLFKIKKLYLFHHEPTYDDKKLNSILKSARWYSERIYNYEVEVFLSTEGLEITL